MGKPSSGKEATDGRGLVWFCCLAWTPSRVCLMAAFFSGCNCSDCIGSLGGRVAAVGEIIKHHDSPAQGHVWKMGCD